jgi:hypothetical protein
VPENPTNDDDDTASARPLRRGGHVNLQWILLHMVEETARHNEAAQISCARQAVDGMTGE